MRPPLATRMPEAMPAGLKWAAANVAGGNWKVNGAWITDDQAELLFIGNAVKVLASKTSIQRAEGDGGAWMLTCLDRIGTDSLPAILAAALHRLADERDAAKVTT